MAKQGKELFDEIATIYGIAQQSIFIHEDEGAKLQQIAACDALFAIRLAKDYNLNVIDAAPYVPYWILKISNTPNSLDCFEIAPLPNDAATKKRAEGIRAGGIDYTSKENIHKVIDPLFLNDLKAELEKIKSLSPSTVKARMLLEFQKKLADIKCFDPAAGCGNFLVEAYVSLRKLENEVLAELENLKGQVLQSEKPP